MTTPPAATAPPLSLGTWALDPNHTSVAFSIRHLGVAQVRGRFGAVTATLVVGPTLAESGVTATVDLASIDTGNVVRDADVRAANVLDVEHRLTMSYRSTQVHAGDEGAWTVDGELTIGDVTRPVTLATALGGVEAFFDGTRHAGFEATGEISRQDFGLVFGPLDAILGDIVRVEIDIQFVEPA